MMWHSMDDLTPDDLTPEMCGRILDCLIEAYPDLAWIKDADISTMTIDLATAEKLYGYDRSLKDTAIND